MTSIASHLEAVRRRIDAAAKRAGRDPAEITLVAVSKRKPTAMIHAAFEAGQRTFGENYAQELRDKAAELADLPIRWHFIGNLQKNKAKYVAPAAAMMETIDSEELAIAMASRAPEKLDCLIEVNIGDEQNKAGVAPEAVPELARAILHLSQLNLRGLMVIPPYGEAPEKSRPYFRRLRELLTELNAQLALDTPLDALSMGMSDDFEVAIEEGATIVRVGTAIFGERT